MSNRDKMGTVWKQIGHAALNSEREWQNIWFDLYMDFKISALIILLRNIILFCLVFLANNFWEKAYIDPPQTTVVSKAASQKPSKGFHI